MAKIKLTEEEKQEQFEWYLELAKNYAVKPLDLNKGKDLVFADFMNRLFAKEFDQGAKIYKLLEKSYAMFQPEKLKEFLSYEDIKIKKPIDLVSAFFNDFIVKTEQPFKNLVEFNDTLAKCYVDEIEKDFGNFAFAPCSNINMKDDFKANFLKYMKDKGYIVVDNYQNFFIRENGKEKIGDENQKVLLNAYETIVKMYIDHYSDFMKKDRQSFDRFWNVVKLNLENIELRLTSESKTSEIFVKNKAKADQFFQVSMKKVLKNSKITEQFEEFEKVKSAVKNLVADIADENDKKTVNDFYKMIEKVGDALSVVGKDGQPYPVNYYLVTKFEPIEFLDIVTYLQKKDIWTDEQKNNLSRIKTLVRQNFPVPAQSPLGKDLKVKEVLDLRFKGVKTKTKSSYVDLSEDSAYTQFVKKVEDVITQHNLPRSELCITLIGKEFMKGREPINFKFVNREK